MRKLFQRSKKFWLLFLIGLTGLVVFLLVVRDPSVELLTRPPDFQKPRLAFLGKWHQPVRMQLQRVKHALFGPDKVLTIHATILELDSPAVLKELREIPTGIIAGAEKNAFVITKATAWKTTALSLSGVKPSNMDVTVMENRQAQLSVHDVVMVGTATNLHKENAGWWLDVWPKVHGDEVKLSCFFTGTERAFIPLRNGTFIQTNFAFGARAEISQGGGLVILSTATNRNGKLTAVILLPSIK